MQIKFLGLFLFIYSIHFSQSLDKIKKLDKKLNEISGLTFLNDSILIAHNDGGNEPVLFFLNLKGEIIHEVLVSNAKNVDWEDITSDKKNYIYLADIGNNLNDRKNLLIYKIKLDSLFFKSSVKAQKIEFSYEDQEEFPPNEKDFHFDAEALAYRDNNLYIFTKSRSNPFDGVSSVYKLSTKTGKQKAKKIATLNLKSRKMIFDGVTAAEFQDSLCYVLTYSGLEIFSFKDDTFTKKDRISFVKLTQKEAMTIRKKKVYIADEKKGKAFPASLYKMKLK
ncbi:MAG: hypothetical protein V4622_05800 [Bacteroidota bacterium]